MERSLLPRELRPFIDERGRLTRWPSRQKVQRMAMTLLARRFDATRTYTELEVNAVLMDGHTFADWALLRRSLIDWRYMDRDGSGREYRLRADAPLAFRDDTAPLAE